MGGSIHWPTEQGLRGDGVTLCTAGLQAALDAAGRGGGLVRLPAGVYRTGTLFLRSGTTLELLPGAVLQASPDLADYPEDRRARHADHGRHLLVADGVSDLTLTGGGTIDGQGPLFWEPRPGPRQWIVARQPRISPLLELRDCRNLHLRDLHILNSPGWTVHLSSCSWVRLQGVRLVNDLFGPNTDGFDLNGCRDVLLDGCFIECGDDAVCLKTTAESRSCERVVVTRCVIRTNCVALKCGTESHHDFRQILFSDCVVHRSTRAVGLYSLDGGNIEGVTVANVVCDTDSGFPLNRPIHLDLRRRDSRPPDASVGGIRQVLVQNFQARTDGRLLLTAADGGWIRDLHLRGIHLEYPILDDPAARADSARSAQFSNHSPAARRARAAVVAERIDGFSLEGLTLRWPERGYGLDWGGEARGEIANPPPGPPLGEPPFHVLWGRQLRRALLDCPMAEANRSDLAKYDLEDCAAVVRA